MPWSEIWIKPSRRSSYWESMRRSRARRLRMEEEKSSLEGMVESRDELRMEITKETDLDRMGEDNDDEEEGEDADDGGDAHYYRA
jgi:DNA-binding helix-hairpin-helix protein with protein kinase domain